jgi:prepilin-type N-terminal cleavage/methylation domain-containing protein
MRAQSVGGRSDVMNRQPQRHAFTLVELLVVIGIIALLISVLLPSLNRARQAGNLVDCQARLQQMGQALQIYVSQNRGLLPWGGIDHTEPWTDNVLPSPAMQEGFWWWMFTLSEVLNKNTMQDGLVRNLSPIFKDRDTIESPQFVGTTEVRWISHYTANPRLLYRADVPDESPRIFTGDLSNIILPPDLVQRKLTSVRHPSSVFVVWDGPQLMDQGARAYPLAEAIDAWGWYNTSGLCNDAPTQYGPSPSLVMGRAILPGQLGVTGRQPGRAFQDKYNFDAPRAFNPNGWLSHLRFRHMGNKRLAALCLDGHVETRYVGEVMVRDIFANYR